MEHLFDARDLKCKSPYGAAPAREPIIFHIFPSRYHGVTAASLFIAADGNPESEHRIRLQWDGFSGACDQFTGSYSLPRPGLYWYYFRIETMQGVFYISRGYASRGELAAELQERFQLTGYDGDYHAPAWFGEGVTYNIFPDRFCRLGLPAADGYRAERVVHEDWNDLPAYQPNKRGEILNNDFFGGSLRGIISKLDYLQSLHVRTLYLNPIFEAYSNHRYDTGDYKKIDPMLGTEADFRDLCTEARLRGMRVILDGVFNHTGFDSLYFNGRGHYENEGAYQSQSSPYSAWYDFSRWPDRYSSWWGIYTLPQVREDCESYQEFIYGGRDSVVRHWLRLGAAGWRLDVADELPDSFIAALNAAAREEAPDALILGEVWEDASNKIAYDERRRYFQGGELDSVMNYPLREAILAYLQGGSAEHFAEEMEILRENYPREVFYSLMNIVGTHDTARLLTVLGSREEDWRADRDSRATARLQGEALRDARRLMQLAVLIQFTMPGSPCIYYGDEAGMQGFEDPFNRRTYPWGREDAEMLAFYRTVCALRDGSDALRRGGLRFLHAEGGVLAYERALARNRVVVAINRDDAPHTLHLPYGAAADLLGRDVYGDENGVTLRLEGLRARVLQCVCDDKWEKTDGAPSVGR